MSVIASGTTHQAMHFNFVPLNAMFMAAAIDFIVYERGCGLAMFHGTSDEAIEFLEAFSGARGLEEWPEFFDFCERKGLPVVRAPLAVDQRLATIDVPRANGMSRLSAGVTHDNFEQVVSDALNAMGIEDPKPATSAQEDDSF